MLCLARKTSERVVITTAAGERIEVTVCESREGKAKLGFEAPTTIRIDREEVDRRRGGPDDHRRRPAA